jgi:hypothetical protein
MAFNTILILMAKRANLLFFAEKKKLTSRMWLKIVGSVENQKEVC